MGGENWSLEWPLGMPMSGSQAESQLTQSLFESQLAQDLPGGALEEVKEVGLEARSEMGRAEWPGLWPVAVFGYRH